MVIAGGFNIYPREIDEVLYQHPKVLDAVSLGIPDPYRGETIKAYIVLRPERTLPVRISSLSARRSSPLDSFPKSIEFRDELPQFAVGDMRS